MFDFDIFLACSPKDFNKLPYVAESIKKNIDGYSDVHICTPIPIPDEVGSLIPMSYYEWLDDEALSIDRSKWGFRPNWTFQQNLKLFQTLTKDWYLTVDCDTIINRPLPMFEGGKPIYYHGLEQIYPPYFQFHREMFGFAREYPRTCISDMNFINSNVVDNMLMRYNMSLFEFIEKSQEITRKNCCMAEPELYGSYVAKYFPDMYTHKDLQQAPFKGECISNVDERPWTDERIRKLIEEMKQHPYDTFSMHSWLDEGDQVKPEKQ